jgi:hypothetical protein
MTLASASARALALATNTQRGASPECVPFRAAPRCRVGRRLQRTCAASDQESGSTLAGPGGAATPAAPLGDAFWRDGGGFPHYMQSKVRNTAHAVDTATHGCPHRSRRLCPTHTLLYRHPVLLSLCLARRRARTWRIASAALLDTQSLSKTPGGASGCSQMRMGHTE